MISDTERREVARRLRELDDSELQVYDMTYFAIQSAVGCEGDQCPDGRELCDRLAGLIDPDTTTDTTKSAPDTAKCDRDALLALADEMERMPQCELCPAEIVDCSAHPDGCPDALLDHYARRIREACGEVG